MVLSNYIYKLIEEGEHQQQDFKYCINDSKKIARSLVAFANSDGGRLLVGVKDNGKIVGISTDEEFYMVESAAKIFSEPPIHFSTKQWQVEGKTVLEITIEPSEKKPHFAKDDNGKWLAYLRIDDENVLAHKIQINVWKKKNSAKGIRFSYSDDEKFLIDFLHKNTATSFSKYFRNANISRRKAENILTDFVLMDVVRMNTSKEGTIFMLNSEFNTNELQKFS